MHLFVKVSRDNNGTPLSGGSVRRGEILAIIMRVERLFIFFLTQLSALLHFLTCSPMIMARALFPCKHLIYLERDITRSCTLRLYTAAIMQEPARVILQRVTEFILIHRLFSLHCDSQERLRRLSCVNEFGLRRTIDIQGRRLISMVLFFLLSYLISSFVHLINKDIIDFSFFPAINL